MMAEQPQSSSFLKRSASIFRRLSKRESRPALAQDASSHNRLQRRPAKQPLNKQMITHLQTIQLPAVGAHVPIASRPRVGASAMRTTPFPASPYVQTVAWNVFLTPEEVHSLVLGFKPREMEDKWFVYAEGPDPSGKLKVHFHRSWTGMKIAELFVLVDLKGEGAGKIVGIKWDGSDQTNGLEQEEVKYMVSTACSFVLGVNLEKGFL